MASIEMCCVNNSTDGVSRRFFVIVGEGSCRKGCKEGQKSVIFSTESSHYSIYAKDDGMKDFMFISEMQMFSTLFAFLVPVFK